jgi:hypothetical protein
VNITIDFEGALARALTPEALNPILDLHIKKAVTNAIEEATGYRSEFQKALKEQMTSALPHGLSVAEVAKFQQILNHSISTMVTAGNEALVKTAFDKALNAVMPNVPTVIKMSELLDEARSGFNKERHEAFYAFFSPCRYTGKGGWLYLDPDENPGEYSYKKEREDKKYKAKYRIAINEKGTVYSLKLDSEDITPASRPDIIGRFESLLMALYVGRTRIEIDMDDNDVDFASQAQEY